jgi:hypothetical protein
MEQVLIESLIYTGDLEQEIPSPSLGHIIIISSVQSLIQAPTLHKLSNVSRPFYLWADQVCNILCNLFRPQNGSACFPVYMVHVDPINYTINNII